MHMQRSKHPFKQREPESNSVSFLNNVVCALAGFKEKASQLAAYSRWRLTNERCDRTNAEIQVQFLNFAVRVFQRLSEGIKASIGPRNGPRNGDIGRFMGIPMWSFAIPWKSVAPACGGFAVMPELTFSVVHSGGLKEGFCSCTTYTFFPLLALGVTLPGHYINKIQITIRMYRPV